MLVQRRADGRLRLVEQHEHGLLSGELAAAWTLPAQAEPLPATLVLATSLHDLGWRELDRFPRRDPASGLPHDFLSFPPGEKYRAATEGIDRVAELHPYCGVLVSLHYAELGKHNAPPGFLEEEEGRRAELLRGLGAEAPEPEEIRRDLAHLQLFDHLSLYLCLTSPGTAAGTLPDWLAAGRFRGVDDRGPLTAEWLDPDRVAVDPFPFENWNFELEYMCRELEGAPFDSDEDLRSAWSRAQPSLRTVRIQPLSRSEARS